MPKGVYTRNEGERTRLRKLRIGQQSPGMFGKHHSEETREKIRIANSGEKHWNYGKSALCPLDNSQCDMNIINDEINETITGNCRHGEWDTNYQTAPCNIENYRKKKSIKSKSKRKVCRCK